MSAEAPPSLRRELGLRLAGAGLAALLALAAVLGAVYAVQQQRLDDRWQRDAQAHFDRQTVRMDEDWVRQTDLLRAQVEFAGVLDDDERVAAARFTALLASMGGQGTFTHVFVLDAAGRTVASYATRTATATLPADRTAQSWSFSEADGLLYRVLRAPLRLGKRGRGDLVVFAPLNNELMSAISFPEAQISLHWRGRGDLALSAAMPPLSSAASGGGARRVEGMFPWAGTPGGPVLHVSRVSQEVLSLSELLLLAGAGVLGGALLAWLAIGRWARRHVHRIDTLSSAVDRFAAGGHRASALGTEVSRATASADLELRQLGEGLAAMMRATEAADDEKAAARQRLADLNATLEQRVTERTRELAVARDEALAAARAKQQILAGVSHELRTPLVGLMGSLELVDAGALPSHQRDLIDVARRSGQALRNVVDDVLDYSRLEVVGAELRQLPFRVDDLAAEAVALHAAIALHKGLTLECHCSEESRRVVRGDPVRLRQVLLNLVGNAVKFTDAGRIELAVEAASAPAAPGHLALRFTVRDSGIGIDEAAQGRLFTPFGQAEGAPARGGTGLGLAISQRLVAAMGSRIQLQSRPGAGSTFWFELQLPLHELPQANVAEPPAPVRLRGHALIVEDNAVNRVILVEMLRRLGLEVAEAENGLLAIEALRERPADIVLMDSQMPVLDGLAASRRIRAGEAGALAAGVPIVAVTANALGGDVQRCYDAGMTAYLSKPFTLEELAVTLRQLLPAQDAQPANV